MSNEPLRILVLSEFDGNDANVIRDFLFSFNAYSRHQYYYIFNCQQIDRQFDFACFDVILIFWSVDLRGSSLSAEAYEAIRRAPALKVLFLQDEYRAVRPINRLMSRLGIQVMFTCVAEADHRLFYPADLIPSLEACYTVLTGYVPAYLEDVPLDPDTPRPLDIGYRSRALPYYLGDISREKIVIADRFQQISQQYGFRSDISVREADRIYGQRWVDFVRASRFALGTSSGASVIDFSGEIGYRCERFLLTHPAASYAEVKQRFFADVDWKVVIDTISPRTFEAVALGCTLVQHEGQYGGILQPAQHYILVKKDYSNIDEVVRQMRDEGYCRHLAENAYRDLIASGAYSYRAFVQRFDRLLAQHASDTLPRKNISKIAFYAQQYVRHGQNVVPNGAQFRRLPSTLLTRSLRRLRRYIGLIGSVTGLTKLIWRWAQRPELRRTVALRQIILETQILRGVGLAGQAARLEAKPFAISVELDAESGTLLLTSQRLTPGANVSHDGRLISLASQAKIIAALQSGQVNKLVLDHGQLGQLVPTSLTNSATPQTYVGPSGICVATSLTQLAKHFPETVGTVITSALRSNSS